MMIIGTPPFRQASDKQASFNWIINGKIIQLLGGWNKLQYVNIDLISLFESIFKYENQRCDLVSIKKCKWLTKTNQ